MDFVKGHGTGNDFVLVADPDRALALGADDAAALCDRRTGIGADGLIVATRTAAMPDAERTLGGDTTWFMDYRNADGSAAEMCGNGIRVFAAFLERAGLESAASISIGTRAGVKTVERDEAGYRADLGTWTIGAEPVVRALGLTVARPGLAVDVGNPHVVVALADAEELDALDLGAAPVVTPEPEHGANVEFVVPIAIEADEGHIRMRVHERGSGETRSCGTGAVAAALATRHWAGGSPDRWRVDVPGGTLHVTVERGPGADRAWLAGPATLVYTGVVDEASMERTTSSTR